jgi:acyl-CoA reductase-like NAD-dependent aldehyde dehydrogenase
MIEVVQAFDRAPITRLDSDDIAALERKIEAARRLFADRRAWLKTHRRMEVLRKLAELMEGKREHLGGQIARECGNAIAAANTLPVAFQASIFMENLRTAFDAAEHLAASAVMVNDHTAFRTDWMPFAGRRQSGYGIGGIPWTMREMTEEKMIVFRM